VAGKDFFGPEFQKALDREMARTVMHSSTGREILRERERRGSQEKPFKLRGEPGSPERIAWVASQVDPSIADELDWDLAREAWAQVGVALQDSLRTIRDWEETGEFGEEAPPEVFEAFSSAARLLGSVGDPQLYQAFANELEAIGSEFSEHLPGMVEYAQGEQRLEDYDLVRAHEQARLDDRHEMLTREYDDIAKRTGPLGLQAAHEFLTELGDTTYDPAMDEDTIRAAARATAESAAAAERGIGVMGFLAEFDKEAARIAGPGSHWNDQERERWEAEQRAGTVEVVERKFGSPELHDDRAITGMLLDDHKRETGKPMLQHQIEHALDEHDSHARQNLPHLDAMREAEVRDWERTHDPDGFDRSQIDGQGRDHGGEYEQPRRDG